MKNFLRRLRIGLGLRKEYCLGFVFTTMDRSHVVLIRKNKPEWQHGLLNGLGGCIEWKDADAHEAMSREYREEAGVWTHDGHWDRFAELILANGDRVHCFAGLDGRPPQTLTDEKVEIHEVWKILRGDESIVYNLKWLLPLALDPNMPTITARYEPETGFQ